MLELLFIGDPHLGKLTKFGWDEEIGLNYQFQALRDAFKYAKACQIEHVIILGDIFDTPFPEQHVLVRLLQALDRQKAHKIHLILGNHDVSDANTHSLQVPSMVNKLGALKHVKIYTQPERLDLEIPIVLLPWPHFQIKNLIKPQEFGLVVCHLDFIGASSDAGHILNSGQVMPNGPQYWVSGHLHTKQTYKYLNYPGTLGQINIVESPEKYFLHTKIQDKRVIHQHVPYNAPWKLYNLVIDSEEKLAQIETAQENHRYRLVIKNSLIVPNKLALAENIYKKVGYKEASQLEGLVENSLELTSDQLLTQFDPVLGLEKYLETKGHAPKLIKKTVKLAKTLAQEIS